MPVNTSMKSVKMHLFNMGASGTDNFESLFAEKIYPLNTVAMRRFTLIDGRGEVCGMRQRREQGEVTLIHVGRVKQGAFEEIISTNSAALETDSIDTSLYSAPDGNEYLQSQILCAFYRNKAVVITSDGLCYNDLWAFVRNVIGDSATIFPRKEISKKLLDAINSHSIKEIRLTGLSKTESVGEILKDQKSAGFFDTGISRESRGSCYNVQISLKPKRGLSSEFIASQIKDALNLDDDSTSLPSGGGRIEILTKNHGTIDQEGLCKIKVVNLQKNGNFVFRDTAWEEMKQWIVSLIREGALLND